MKKISAILLILVILLTFGACGNNQKNDAANKLESALGDALSDMNEGNVDMSELENAISEYAQSVSGKIEGFDNINDYIKACMENSTFKQTVETLAQSGIALVVEADGNNLVYKYTYTVPIIENTADILKDDFEKNDSVFTTNADTIRIEAPCVEKVIWAYYSMDGELLASLTK